MDEAFGGSADRETSPSHGPPAHCDPLAFARRALCHERRLVELRRGVARARLKEALDARQALAEVFRARQALRAARRVLAPPGLASPDDMGLARRLIAFAGGAATAHAALREPAALFAEIERVRADIKLLSDDARRAGLGCKLQEAAPRGKAAQDRRRDDR